MADAEDTQPSPMETPPIDETTVPSAEPDTETKEDLLTAWATSPAELGNPDAPLPGWWMSQQAPLPCLAIW